LSTRTKKAASRITPSGNDDGGDEVVELRAAFACLLHLT
jgi:hypothetical protein